MTGKRKVVSELVAQVNANLAKRWVFECRCGYRVEDMDARRAGQAIVQHWYTEEHAKFSELARFLGMLDDLDEIMVRSEVD